MGSLNKMLISVYLVEPRIGVTFL
uniref:Uncharacterized protein n=1 Tax=Arundo donax TaxID=35708 RepID=A0A0A9BIL3_ARUDO